MADGRRTGGAHDERRLRSGWDPDTTDVLLPLEVGAGVGRARRRLAAGAELVESLAHPGVPRVVAVDLNAQPSSAPVDEAHRPGVTLRVRKGTRLTDVLASLHGHPAHDPALHGLEGAGLAEGERWSFVGALKIFMRLVETVAYAHAAGVVHRGLDPDHVRIGRFGEVQVTDWSLARDLAEEDLHDLRRAPLDPGDTPFQPLTTVDGERLPSASYAAPELLAGQQYDVGKAADVFALGAILHHLLAGHPPHQVPHDPVSPALLWERAREAGPAPVRVRRRLVSQGLLRVARQAQAAQRLARFPDAQALLSALEGVVSFGYARTGPVQGLVLWANEHRAAAALFVAVLGALGLRGALGVSGDEPLGPTGGVVAAADRTAPRPGTLVPAPLDAALGFEFVEPRPMPFVPRPEPAQALLVAESIAAGPLPTDALARGRDELFDEHRRLPAPTWLVQAGAFTFEVLRDALHALRHRDRHAEWVATRAELEADAGAGSVPPKTSDERFQRLLASAEEALADGRAREAAQSFERVYRAQMVVLGEDHTSTLRTRRQWAASLAADGDTERAVIHYLGCLALHTERDAFRLDLEREFALLLLERGERDEGEERLLRAGLLAEELYGLADARVAQVYDQLGSSGFRHGDFACVADAFERGLASREAAAADTPPADRADVISQRTTLVQIYQRLDRPADALRHARALLEATPAEHAAHGARQALVASLAQAVDGARPSED